MIGDAYDFVEAHPEIQRARLIWSWDFDAEIHDKGKFSGDYLDCEYSFIGDRAHLLIYLQMYSCWDSLLYDSDEPRSPFRDPWFITDDGLLECEHVEGNYSQWVRDEIPPDSLVVMKWDEEKWGWDVIQNRSPEDLNYALDHDYYMRKKELI